MAETLTATHEEQQQHHHHPAPGGIGRLTQFLHDTRQEMRKVVTPTRAEVQTNTLIVIVTVFIFAAYFELVDLIFGKGIDKIFLKLTHH